MALGSVSEWLKEAASKTVDRVKAVRRFESCRFRFQQLHVKGWFYGRPFIFLQIPKIDLLLHPEKFEAPPPESPIL